MYREYKEPRRSYAAFVSNIDDKIGQVVKTIDGLGLREQTVIIFLSDHGHSQEIRNNFGGSGGSAGPHRGHKFTLWEGGIRVPCIVSWPGRIPENAVRHQAATSMDWLPTIAHSLGIDLPDRRLDGKSIAQVIASPDSPSPHDAIHWQTGGGKGHWAVRQGDWKLVFNGPASEFRGQKIPRAERFLTNLARDLSETDNLAGENADIVRRLMDLHERWVVEVREQ